MLIQDRASPVLVFWRFGTAQQPTTTTSTSPLRVNQSDVSLMTKQGTTFRTIRIQRWWCLWPSSNENDPYNLISKGRPWTWDQSCPIDINDHVKEVPAPHAWMFTLSSKKENSFKENRDGKTIRTIEWRRIGVGIGIRKLPKAATQTLLSMAASQVFSSWAIYAWNLSIHAKQFYCKLLQLQYLGEVVASFA